MYLIKFNCLKSGFQFNENFISKVYFEVNLNGGLLFGLFHLCVRAILLNTKNMGEGILKKVLKIITNKSFKIKIEYVCIKTALF